MDLSTISGVLMSLDETGALRFDPTIVVDEYKVRLLDELTAVYLDQQVCRGKDVAYSMYNGVYRKEDAAKLSGIPMRYELTLFPEKQVGREYVKTLGHIHKPEPVSGIDYPEICEVLVGTAHFIFQTLDVSGPDSSTVFCVEVKAGEKIVMPPGFDHLTINPGPGPMLFSDVVGLNVTGDYTRISAARGAAYLEVNQGGKPEFIPNPHYRRVGPLKKMKPREFPQIHLTRNTPLYTAFLETGGNFWKFLVDPTLFKPAFKDLNELFQS